MDEITVHLSYYDDSSKPPEVFKVSKNTTANQLYGIVTTKYARCKFELYNDDTPLEHCHKPITEMFKDEVNIQLIEMNDGAGVGDLVSNCPACPNAGGDQCKLCGPCNDLTKETIIEGIVIEIEDAWLRFSKIYQLTSDVRNKIEENCEDPYIRCIDVMHHLYHDDLSLTWENVMSKVKTKDRSLAVVIDAAINLK
ncbi:uncharacterized protein [Dysidea avara]|uniref:uncharacterized protein n=1 Tax=Dysidea avara TaxID=196820 RepID=UPI0033336D4C